MHSESLTKHHGLAAALLSAALSGVATIFAAGAVRELSPLLVIGTGQLAGALLLIAMARQGQVPLKRSALHDNAFLLIRLIILRGVLSAGLFGIGLGMTESIKAVFFTKIEPYFVLAWGALVHGERHRPAEYVLLAVHVLGALVLSTGGDLSTFGQSQLGDLCIVTAMAISGTTYAASRKLVELAGARYAGALTVGGGACIVLPIALIASGDRLVTASMEGWLYQAVHVVLFYVAALPLWFHALSSVKGWVVSALRAVGPLAGAPVAYLLFGETLSGTQLLGGLAVVLTSALISRYR
ncbi:MAG: DMT family transporter [Bdellovibrionota bacterium]|nr:MAG: DMT family transporter [Bdellovibrionota bacterium]